MQSMDEERTKKTSTHNKEREITTTTHTKTKTKQKLGLHKKHWEHGRGVPVGRFFTTKFRHTSTIKY